MKIKINDFEAYDINLPDEVSGQQFFEVVGRLNQIMRLIGKDPLLSIAKAVPQSLNQDGTVRKKKKGFRPWTKNREEAIYLLRLHYVCRDKDVKNAYAREQGMIWNDITKTISNVKQRWDIKPEEVGISHYPSLGKCWDFTVSPEVDLTKPEPEEPQEETEENHNVSTNTETKEEEKEEVPFID